MEVTTKAARCQQAPPMFALMAATWWLSRPFSRMVLTDGTVLRARERKRTLAGGIQSLIAKLLAHTDNPLRATQVHQHRVVEHHENQRVTGWPDLLRAS